MSVSVTPQLKGVSIISLSPWPPEFKVFLEVNDDHHLWSLETQRFKNVALPIPKCLVTEVSTANPAVAPPYVFEFIPFGDLQFISGPESF